MFPLQVVADPIKSRKECVTADSKTEERPPDLGSSITRDADLPESRFVCHDFEHWLRRIAPECEDGRLDRRA